MVSLITVVLGLLAALLIIANFAVSQFPKRKRVNVTFIPPADMEREPVSRPQTNAFMVSTNQKILQINSRLGEIERFIAGSPHSEMVKVIAPKEKQSVEEKQTKKQRKKLKKSFRKKNR
jgi:hypothetical protein